MAEDLKEVEEILANLAFQSWYFRDADSGTTEWDAWMRNHPEKRHLVDQAILFMNAWPREKKVSAAEIEDAFHNLQTTLREEEPVISRSSGFTLWKWVAAAAAIFLIGFWAVRQYDIKDPEEVWQTDFGQLEKITLPDGTIVTLNANSRLTGQQNWKNLQDRELWLEGEAFFEVEHLANGQKMIVHTNEGDIVVTGTQFNVRSRDSHTSVLLTEGKVTILSKNGTEMELSPGEFATLSGEDLRKVSTNERQELAWKDGKLIFDQTPLSVISKMIEEHYGKKVELQGNIDESRTLTGIMPNNQLNDLLEAIRLATGWKIYLAENSIIIVVN